MGDVRPQHKWNETELQACTEKDVDVGASFLSDPCPCVPCMIPEDDRNQQARDEDVLEAVSTFTWQVWQPPGGSADREWGRQARGAGANLGECIRLILGKDLLHAGDVHRLPRVAQIREHLGNCMQQAASGAAGAVQCHVRTRLGVTSSRPMPARVPWYPIILLLAVYALRRGLDVCKMST